MPRKDVPVARIQVTLPQPLLDSFDEFWPDFYTSRSGALAEAIRDFLDKKRKKR